MPEIDPVILQLRADVASYNATMQQTARRVDASLKSQEASIVRLEGKMGKGFARIGQHAARGAASIKAAIGSIGLIALGAQAVETAIRFQRFEKGLEIATGSASAAADEIKFLREMADTLGIRFITLAENFTSFAAASRGTALEGEKARVVFESITKAIVAVGGSTEQVNGALLAVQQMMSKGKVSAEELNGQLGERLPGAFNIAARAMGVTTGELGKMLEKGDVLATDFLPKFAAQLGQELPANLQTADAAFQRFQTALDDIANSTADGFMKELGEATDDLTQTLKDMQASGALEAVGSFLGQIIRLGGGAASVIGDLALAWKRLRLEVGVKQQQNIETGWLTSAAQKEQARKNRTALEAELIRMNGTAKTPFAKGSLDSLDAIIKAQGSPAAPAVSSGGKKTGGKKGPSGPTAEEITARFNDALSRLVSERLQAELSVTTDAVRRADIQRELLDIEYKQRLDDINSQKEFSAERKAAMRAELNALFGMGEGEAHILTVPSVYSAVDRELADEQRRMAQEALSRQREALEAEANLVTNRVDRLAAENRILDILEQEEKARLEQQIANGQITDALKARAELERAQSARRTGTAQQYESPMERRRREVRDTAANMGDAIENIELDAIDRLTDGLADAGTEFIKLGGIAGDVLNSIIRDMIRLAAQQFIFGGGDGGGGGLVSGIGSLIAGARASGGPVQGGKTYLVGEEGPELFRAPGAGTIIPNNELAGAAARSMVGATASATPRQTIVHQSFTLDARYGITTPELLQHVNETARRESANAGSAAYAASQQSAPGTINKFSQLKG